MRLDDASLMDEILEEAQKLKTEEEKVRKEKEEKERLRRQHEEEQRRVSSSVRNEKRNAGTTRLAKEEPRSREVPHMYGDGIIGPKTSFATHAEALNICFGYQYKHFQMGYKNLENGYAVWFPSIARIFAGKYLSSDDYRGWLNILSDSGDTITQMDNPSYSRSKAWEPDPNKRVIFARFEGERRYRFIGIFVFEKRSLDRESFRRIGTLFDTKKMEIIE